MLLKYSRIGIQKLSVLIVGVLGVLAGSIHSAHAYDFIRNTPPRSWYEPLMPEDLPPLKHPEYFDAIDKARAQVMSGRYKLALATLYQIKDEVDPVQVALIRATALSALGRGEQALETLSQPAVADHADVQVKRAAVLSDLGREAEAIALLNDHLKQHPLSLGGHYYLGLISEKIGDTDTARRAYGWFFEEPQRYLDKWQGQAESFESAEEVTLIARALDRHSTLTGAYQNDPNLHNLILNMFVRAYDVIDRTYWPARVAAAEYFLSHDQKAEAGEELAVALEANPNDARAHRLVALISLDRFDFDAADQAIANMRAVNRDSIDADILDARSLLTQRRPKDAERPLKQVLERHPKHLEAMGLLAAAAALQLREDEATSILRQVEQIDPDNATAYHDVAEYLGSMRQYPRSAAMYKIAIERAPWWTAPRNGLGLLYTQSGDEDDARAVLAAAHELDPFNVATTNYLRLLDDLEKFDRKESEHFIVFYDGTIDPLIPEYFSEYLESVYLEVTGNFKHEPSEKTMIEVFPTHDGFSVRTTGSPWIGTVGASTGRVIALVSPRDGKNTMGAFHWAQVLRHEFTHTVTLSATDNRIAHWMTEGLAVLEERVPLRWEWVPMLYRAVTRDELFTMDELTWGFVRPRKATDRPLAYAQSYWVCKYIQDTYGHDAILKMLEQFKAGHAQEDVFPSVLGKNLDEFTQEFFAWTKKQVDRWGYDAETRQKYDVLRSEGESLIQSRQYEQALTKWQEIAKLRPVDALPHQRLAGLYIRLNQPDKAVEHLVALHKVEIKDNRYAKRIARIYRDIDQLEEATRYAKESVYINPYDVDAHELLAELYEKTGDEAGLSRERRVLAVLEEWHQRHREPVTHESDSGPSD